jgi:hypothetical protein
MKRLRGNGGARDSLKREGIALLSKRYGGQLLERFGRKINKDEFIAIRPSDPALTDVLRRDGKIV